MILQAKISQLELVCEANDQILAATRDQVLAAQALTTQRERELATVVLEATVLPGTLIYCHREWSNLS
jgi:hypothetical protein